MRPPRPLTMLALTADTVVVALRGPQQYPSQLEPVPDEGSARVRAALPSAANTKDPGSPALAGALAKVIGPCKAMGSVFAGVETATPETRLRRLAQQMPRAWVECGCRPDLAWVVAALLTDLDQLNTSGRLIALTDRSQDTLHTELSAAAPWGEVVEALGRGACLRVSPEPSTPLFFCRP